MAGEKTMIHIDFDPGKLEEPLRTEWQNLAEQATQKAIEAWETWKEKADISSASVDDAKIAWSEEIWRDLKKWLLTNVFHEKCAYCETRILRFNAHAEHFRPK